MLKDFTNCVKNGGKVKTKNLKGDRYINICYDKEGKAHPGEVRSKKKDKAIKTKKKADDAKKLLESLKKLQEHFNSRRQR